MAHKFKLGFEQLSILITMLINMVHNKYAQGLYKCRQYLTANEQVHESASSWKPSHYVSLGKCSSPIFCLHKFIVSSDSHVLGIQKNHVHKLF